MTDRLPRLGSTQPPWGQFQVMWQQMVEKIEGRIDDLEAAELRVAIGQSFTVPTLMLTATDAGASATITIANHRRVYSDGTALDVTGGTITGLAYSTNYAVYYDDDGRSDATPAYVATTDLKEGQSNYVAGRHYAGSVRTPAALGAATTGGVPPPGTGYSGGSTSITIP